MSRDFLPPFRTWIALLGAVSACASAVGGCSPTRIFAAEAPDAGSDAGDSGGSGGNSASAGKGGSESRGGGSNAGGAPSGDAGEPGTAGGANTAGAGNTAGGANAECATADDCPGIDTECAQRTCSDGKCGEDKPKSGVVLTAQTPGDCQQAICDGNGEVTTKNDDADKPDDGNVCVTDACTNGVPTHGNAPNTTACGAASQFKCDGKGVCGGCTQNSDCGVDNLCATYACTAGTCKTTFVPNGQGNLANTPKDCQKNVCNGTGSPITIADATDLPVDANLCTKDVCTNGVPSNPGESNTKSCGAFSTCNGAGVCVCSDPLASACARAGAQCGPVVDGCNNHVTCPNTCNDGINTCNGAGNPNACGCTPHALRCGALQCGGTVSDGCGHSKDCTADCQFSCPDNCATKYCAGTFCQCSDCQG